MKSIAIVGGGITGLSAAFRLNEKNIPVTLYEEGSRVGGVLQTIREDGYLSEFGPNTILETSPKITELIHDLGLDPRRLTSHNRKNYIVRNGKLHLLPLSPFAFATTRLFSPWAKVCVALEPFVLNRAKSDDEALADFVLRRLGREFLDYAINPFVSGVYAGDPARLSVKYGFPKLHALEKKYNSLIAGAVLGFWERKKRKEVSKQAAGKVSFDEGLQVLTETLHAKLSPLIRLQSPVTGLEKNGEEWIVTAVTDGHEVREEHSAVILAASAHKLADIRIGNQSSLSALSQIEHPPVARIVFGFRREDVDNPLEGFGFLVPEKEGLSILGTTFSSSIFANRAPAGHVLLTTFVGGARHTALAASDPEKIYELTLADLRKVLGVKGKPTYRHFVFYPKAIPQYTVGYGKYLSLMTGLEEKFPGLFFAGNYRDGISLGNSMISGQEIAVRVGKFVDAKSVIDQEKMK